MNVPRGIGATPGRRSGRVVSGSTAWRRALIDAAKANLQGASPGAADPGVGGNAAGTGAEGAWAQGGADPGREVRDAAGRAGAESEQPLVLTGEFVVGETHVYGAGAVPSDVAERAEDAAARARRAAAASGGAEARVVKHGVITPPAGATLRRMDASGMTFEMPDGSERFYPAG